MLFAKTAISFIRANHDDLIFIKACKSPTGQIFAWGRHERRNDVMVNKPEHSPAKLSRRSVLLHGAACVTGAATILVANANSAKANPLPKTAVSYQDTPKGDRQCSNCSLFVAPNGCKNVVGEISPNGWCVLWRKA
jgi:hypothetical protein